MIICEDVWDFSRVERVSSKRNVLCGWSLVLTKLLETLTIALSLLCSIMDVCFVALRTLNKA